MFFLPLQVTVEDATRHEIIQLLCVEPMSHSALNKSLTVDLVTKETGMEKVVESVATLTKPASGTARRLYELKPEFYNRYNVFYYHYTKEEQSKSVENQRQRRQKEGLPLCNPPPVPPR